MVIKTNLLIATCGWFAGFATGGLDDEDSDSRDADQESETESADELDEQVDED